MLSGELFAQRCLMMISSQSSEQIHMELYLYILNIFLGLVALDKDHNTLKIREELSFVWSLSVYP